MPTSAAAPSQPAPALFYVYSGEALDHSFLTRCDGFDALMSGAHARLAAEVGMHAVLRTHERRTHDPRAAGLFYVPVYEYVSFKLARLCGANTSHAQRMRAASDALLASPYWRASGGRDHFVLSTAFSHPAPIATRTLPLSKALRCAMAGRYKRFALGYKRTAKSAWGICAVEAPYVAPKQAAFAASARRLALTVTLDRSVNNRSLAHALNPHKAAGAYSARADAAHYHHPTSLVRAASWRVDPRADDDGFIDDMPEAGVLRSRAIDEARTLAPARPIFLHFAGGLDVCCYGQATRCAVGRLMVSALADAPDVLIRPQMPVRPALAGPCFMSAMRGLLAKSRRYRAPEPSLSTISARQQRSGFLGDFVARLTTLAQQDDLWRAALAPETSAGQSESPEPPTMATSHTFRQQHTRRASEEPISSQHWRGGDQDAATTRAAAAATAAGKDADELSVLEHARQHSPRRAIAHTASSNDSTVASLERSRLLDNLVPHSHGAVLSDALIRQTELEMSLAVWCLVPAGDSAVTDRLVRTATMLGSPSCHARDRIRLTVTRFHVRLHVLYLCASILDERGATCTAS